MTTIYAAAAAYRCHARMNWQISQEKIMMPTPSKFPYGLLLLCGVSGTLMDLMNCLSLCFMEDIPLLRDLSPSCSDPTKRLLSHLLRYIPWWKTTSSCCLLSTTRLAGIFMGDSVGRIAISPNPTFLQVLIISFHCPFYLWTIHNTGCPNKLGIG